MSTPSHSSRWNIAARLVALPAMTQLLRPCTRSAALVALACAPTMELIKDILTAAHEPSRLADRLALIRRLPKLALVGRDSRDSTVLQFVEFSRLVPRCRIPSMLVQDQPALRHLLEVQLAHPHQVNSPRLLLILDNLEVAFLVVDELPCAEISEHGRAYKQSGLLCV